MTRLICLMVALLPFLSRAQTQGGLSVALMTESIAFPLTRISPIHPGMEIGYTFYVKEKSIKHSASVLAGGYLHERVENAFYIRAEYSHHFKIKHGLQAYTAYGLGYMHTFYPSEVYELNEDGEFERIRQIGRPHVLATLGVGLMYESQSRFAPFIRQDLTLESPFANGIPVIIHSFLKIGTTIKLRKS